MQKLRWINKGRINQSHKYIRAKENAAEHEKTCNKRYIYNLLAVLNNGDKMVYKQIDVGSASLEIDGLRTKFFNEIIGIIMLHKKDIDCLESKILRKVIEQNGKFICNLVTNGVNNSTANDCESKLKHHFKSDRYNNENKVNMNKI